MVVRNTLAAVFLVVALSLTACGGSGNGSGGGESNGANGSNSIVGEWHHIYPATQCLEVNIFFPDRTFYGSALDEVYTGNYQFDSTAGSGGRHKLKVSLEEDNQQADCRGRMTDGAGVTRTVYAQFVNADEVVFHAKKSAFSPIITFERNK